MSAILPQSLSTPQPLIEVYDPDFEFGKAEKFKFTEPPTPLLATAEKAASTSVKSFNADLRKAFLAYWDNPRFYKEIQTQKGCSGFRCYLNAFEYLKKNPQCLSSFEALKAVTKIKKMKSSPEKLLDLLSLYNSLHKDPVQKLPIPPSPLLRAPPKPRRSRKESREKLEKALRSLWIDRLPDKECIRNSGCGESTFSVYKSAAERFYSFFQNRGTKRALSIKPSEVVPKIRMADAECLSQFSNRS